MSRWILTLGAVLLVSQAIEAAAENLRFDPNQGVIGPTAAKRKWLDQALKASVNDPAQLRMARRQLRQMKPNQINAAANGLLAQQLRLRRAQAIGRGFHGGFAPGAIGFAPVVTWFPEGAQLGVGAVVAPDGRSVRVTASPFFSSIPFVDTFNFHTGRSTRHFSPPRPLGWNHMPPPPPSAHAPTWHDGLRTRVGSRPEDR